MKTGNVILNYDNGSLLMKDLPPTIHVGDSRHMDEVEDGSVTLVVTSPPYNVDKEYEKGMSFDEWLQLMHDVMKECDRKLIPGGRACINVASTDRHPYKPLYKYIIDISEEMGWEMRGTVIWLKGGSGSGSQWGSFGSASNPVLRDSHEFILVFHKGRGNGSILAGESGIMPDEFVEFSRAEWYFSPVQSTASTGHPAPFPDELPRRCILFWSSKGDTVLDPFGGSGTTWKVAKALGRNPVMYELNEKYIPAIKKNITSTVKIQSDAHEKFVATREKHPELASLSLRELKRTGDRVGLRSMDSMTKLELIVAIAKRMNQPRLDDYR